MKIRKGKVYGLFPVEMKDDGPHMMDCFMNNYMFWLFEIMNEIEAIACWCLDIPHYFIIDLQKEKEENKK